MITFHALLIPLFLVGNALFAGLETGVISLNQLRLRHEVRKGIPGTKKLKFFADNPDHLLGTTLVGDNLCMVGATVVATSIASDMLGPARGGTVSGIVMALVVLVVGQYLPKAWFRGNPSKRSRMFAGFLYAAGMVLYPISKVVMNLSRVLVPAPTPEDRTLQPLVTKEELRHLALEGEQTGELTPSERRMMDGVFELASKQCQDIMVPREKIVQVEHDTPVEELLEIARTNHLTRLPCYDEDAKRFIGIVHVLDALRDPEHAGKKAEHYMRPPQFISSTTPADELLPRMRMNHQPMALVTNTRSEVVGLVTIQVVWQEIVGKFNV